MSKKAFPENPYERILFIKRLFNKAVHEAQEENRRLGLPNVFSRNGVIYYELNGKITTEDPTKEGTK